MLIANQPFAYMRVNISIKKGGGERMKKRKEAIWVREHLQESVEIILHHYMGSNVRWCLTECDAGKTHAWSQPETRMNLFQGQPVEFDEWIWVWFQREGGFGRQHCRRWIHPALCGSLWLLVLSLPSMHCVQIIIRNSAIRESYPQ